mmetsp:Transcript_79596/g.184766  ORF Transcript_79596/g.184766 Transcript_79596/m.184766 type:complete len:149 (-) Transcript_79596:101-547(-)
MGRDAACPAYFARNDIKPPLADRTLEQRVQFKYAMWDMGRLYSYEECEVIVLPQFDKHFDKKGSSWPGGSVWGAVNERSGQMYAAMMQLTHKMEEHGQDGLVYDPELGRAVQLLQDDDEERGHRFVFVRHSFLKMGCRRRQQKWGCKE